MLEIAWLRKDKCLNMLIQVPLIILYGWLIINDCFIFCTLQFHIDLDYYPNCFFNINSPICMFISVSFCLVCLSVVPCSFLSSSQTGGDSSSIESE